MVIDCSNGGCDELVAPFVGVFIVGLVVLAVLGTGIIAVGMYLWRWIGVELPPRAVRWMAVAAAGPMLGVLAALLPPALVVVAPVLWWRFTAVNARTDVRARSGLDDDVVVRCGRARLDHPRVGP